MENVEEGLAEEDELSSEAGTHPNVVLGSIRAKPELHYTKHVFSYISRECRDLLRLKHD